MKSRSSAQRARPFHALAAAMLLALLPSAGASDANLTIPPAPHNEADGIIRVTWGSPAGTGVAPERSYMTVDIQPAGGPTFTPTPPIPAGRYAMWCFDVATDINPDAAGTLYGGRLYSTGDPDTAFNAFLPDHPNVMHGAATWKKINYLINHRTLACNGQVPTMWEVQHSIFLLLGQVPPPAPPYPSVRAAVVQCLVDSANANAASWELKCGDKIAVIFNVDLNWDENTPDVQLVILEVPVPCSSLGNYVWNDLNVNGRQDVGEPGVPEVEVELYRCLDNALVAVTTTDDTGYYLFSGLIPGDYYVKVIAPTDFLFTIQNATGTTAENDSDVNMTGVMACTTLDAGENDLTWDAGLYQMASIGDRVWEDVNKNGLQDPGETGVDGVTVELYSCVGNVLKATTTTAGGGLYLFNVVPGDYYVKFSNLPAGYVFSPSGASSASDPIDSDANPLTGVTDCTTLAAGEDDMTWDAGIYKPTPVMLVCAGGTGVIGSPYSSFLVASGGTAPYTFSVFSGSLPPGLELNPATGAITGIPTAAGDFNFTAKVIDSTIGTALSSTSNCTIKVGGLPCVQGTFTFSGNTSTSGSAGNIREYTLNGVSVRVSAFSRAKSGSDPWGPAYLGAYSGGLGVTDPSEGSGSGNSHTVDNSGRNNYVLFEFSQPVEISRAFLGYVVNDSDLTAWVGNAVNPYADHLTLSDTVLSTLTREENPGIGSTRWATLNTSGLSGNVLVIATSIDDTLGNDAFKIAALDVCLPSPAVTLACVSRDTGKVGTSYSSKLVATGGVPGYTFSIVAGTLPAGLTLNPATGEISGTPTVSGSFSFTAQVVDSVGSSGIHTASRTCSINVEKEKVPPVSLDCVSQWAGMQGVPYSAALQADGGTPGYTFSIVLGSLPPGLTLNPSTGAITGTPTHAGLFVFSAKVVDSVGTSGTNMAFRICLIKITSAPNVSLECVAQTTGEVGKAYSSKVTAKEGTPGYTFSIVSGSLPDGLALKSSTGAITGTPTKAGAFNFTVKVVDAGGKSATASCRITVTGAECIKSTFTFAGSTKTYGTTGNIRQYTVNGVSVKVSAFSRATSGSSPWAPAYLGAYDGGLGVTDTSEGTGSGSSHTVDNNGRDNFVLFEFSQPVIVNRAFLGYVLDDSDLSVWVGNANNPYSNHLTVSDGLLSGFTRQDNTGGSSTRWAQFSGTPQAGNVLVIAARLDDSNDGFKIGALDVCVPPTSTLPSPWKSKDIGDVASDGFSNYSGGVFSVAGSGRAIGGADGRDQFRFTYQQATGDCVIVAKVLSVQDTHDGAAAGVMIRDSLSSDAKFAGAFVTAENGIQQQTRSGTGGTTRTRTEASKSAPYWVKVVRSGDKFTMYRSANGTTWTTIESTVTISMGSTVYIGLVANSRDDRVICTATFGNVAATP